MVDWFEGSEFKGWSSSEREVWEGGYGGIRSCRVLLGWYIFDLGSGSVLRLRSAGMN
jgi:hypothetical protein